MLRFLLPVGIFGLLVAVFFIGLGKDPTLVPSPLVGKPAPDFSLPLLEDSSRTFSRQDLMGKTSLVNIWGTWCGGCRQEHDTLLTLAKDSGIPIFGINWKDDQQLAREWLKVLGNPYAAVGVDADGRVAIDWGVYGAPETFLIGPDGTVLYKHIAPITLDVWREKFLPIITAVAGGGR
ncbi:MAG: DsbE family thiol:disulfide interchange protein [Chromatiales bacterium]|jgi:cytochrome c biogenesis protein CcmG/thiol:disulfide interchange protein DsbE|nr:MAG: DsbE family thiol:disulfide interchange protein [Chromatiales bacterium]